MAYGGCFGAVCNYCALRAIRDVIDDENMRHVEWWNGTGMKGKGMEPRLDTLYTVCMILMAVHDCSAFISVRTSDNFRSIIGFV